MAVKFVPVLVKSAAVAGKINGTNKNRDEVERLKRRLGKVGKSWKSRRAKNETSFFITHSSFNNYLFSFYLGFITDCTNKVQLLRFTYPSGLGDAVYQQFTRRIYQVFWAD